MLITHTEARRLIQFSADQALSTSEKALLSTHLDTCVECRSYAAEIADVERILLPLIRRQWGVANPPLSINALQAKAETKSTLGTILTIRRVMVSLVLALFMLSAWQFALSGNQIPGQSTALNLPVQTPSIPSTSTAIDFENCATLLYAVQPNDTLTSIAEWFSIPKEAILSLNGMDSETVDTATILIIPACHLTPTSTVNPIILTTTYTPGASPVTPEPSS